MKQRVPAPTGRCSKSGRDLAPGEAYVGTLRESDAGLERRDYAVDQAPPPAADMYAWWRGRLPEHSPPVVAETPGEDLRLDLFDRLGNSGRAEDSALRFAVAMELIEARALKLQSIEIADGVETLVLSRGRGAPLVRLVNPGLAEEQYDKLKDEIAEGLKTGGL